MSEGKPPLWRYAGFGPRYLKIRSIRVKKGTSEKFYIRAERAGLSPLVEAIPSSLRSQRDIVKYGERRYAEWLNNLSKPASVVEAEKVEAASSARFTDISAKIVEMSKSHSDEYIRKVRYHIKRLNDWHDTHCPFISEWNPNRWKEYVGFRREIQPDCQLNHDKRQLSRVLHYAYNEGLIAKPPKLKNYDSEAQGGRELLSWEIEALFAAASVDLKDAMNLGLRMAFRQIDVRNLTKDRVDFKRNRVSFRRGLLSSEGGSKNKKPIEIELNPICREMLMRRSAKATGNYFFPSKDSPSRPIGTFKTAWYGACERAKVEAGFHCLRHTCATLMARAGVPEAFTQKYCRMSAKVVREIYTHLGIEDNFRAANTVTEKWGEP